MANPEGCNQYKSCAGGGSAAGPSGPKVYHSTSSYEFSHGKKPRGTGAWAFQVQGRQSPKFVRGSKSYGEAKKHISRLAQRYGRLRGMGSTMTVKTLP